MISMDISCVQSQPRDCIQLATFGPYDQNKTIPISGLVFWTKKKKLALKFESFDREIFMLQQVYVNYCNGGFQDKDINSYNFIPFAGGQRLFSCLNLARLDASIFLHGKGYGA
jgi:hypothetical protein